MIIVHSRETVPIDNGVIVREKSDDHSARDRVYLKPEVGNVQI